MTNIYRKTPHACMLLVEKLKRQLSRLLKRKIENKFVRPYFWICTNSTYDNVAIQLHFFEMQCILILIYLLQQESSNVGSRSSSGSGEMYPDSMTPHPGEGDRGLQPDQSRSPHISSGTEPVSPLGEFRQGSKLLLCAGIKGKIFSADSRCWSP